MQFHAICTLAFFWTLMSSVLVAYVPLALAQEGTWPQIFLIPIPNNLSSPVHVTHAGDGSRRLFVVEQEGQIRIRRAGALLDTPFLDIGGPGGRVLCCSERGLLSVAFPPGYAAKQYFYIYYTNRAGNIVVARYHVTPNPDVADPNSEEILLTIDHPTYGNHNGGQLAFGPDGYLYIGTGDGGGSGDPQNNAQNPRSLLGKILRIDVESPPGTAVYGIPESNPYKHNPDYAPEVWALGLRNPWRFSFDRLTGDLYVGDVGQGAYEEIDFQPASSVGGENYGWRCQEGFHDYAGHASECNGKTLTPPVAEYGHGAECSITGGIVYRGARYGNLRGVYFYGDYCSGRIWGLRHSDVGWESHLLLESSLNISSFGEDEAGELYVADHNGAVYKLTTTPPSTDVDLTGAWNSLQQTCRASTEGVQCRVAGVFLVQNQVAQRSAQSAFVTFYLSTDAALSADDSVLQRRFLGRVSAGRTRRLLFRKLLPIGGAASGRYVIAVIDTDDDVPEMVENNNTVVLGPVP